MKPTILNWGRAPEDPKLTEGEIHLWRLVPAAYTESGDRGIWGLSDEEVERAERFCLLRDRDRFLISHSVLRILLGRYLGIDPRRVAFRYGPKGKPDLIEGLGRGGLRLSLSHSGQAVLFAFALDRAVGVDLERIRSLPGMELIVSRLFTAAERASLRSLADEERREAFFQTWVGREALLKAEGEGLAASLEHGCLRAPFQGGRKEGDPIPGPFKVDRWIVREFSPMPGYVAALAVEGQPGPIAAWDFLGQGRREATTLGTIAQRFSRQPLDMKGLR